MGWFVCVLHALGLSCLDKNTPLPCISALSLSLPTAPFKFLFFYHLCLPQTFKGTHHHTCPTTCPRKHTTSSLLPVCHPTLVCLYAHIFTPTHTLPLQTAGWTGDNCLHACGFFPYLSPFYTYHPPTTASPLHLPFPPAISSLPPPVVARPGHMVAWLHPMNSWQLTRLLPTTVACEWTYKCLRLVPHLPHATLTTCCCGSLAFYLPSLLPCTVPLPHTHLLPTSILSPTTPSSSTLPLCYLLTLPCLLGGGWRHTSSSVSSHACLYYLLLSPLPDL